MSEEELRKRQQLQQQSSSQQRTDASGFVSKKLAEVSKGMGKEQLHKDASAMFSSSFEKDAHAEVWFYKWKCTYLQFGSNT